MTHPGAGVPTSPGVPPFEQAAQSAIAAARARLEGFTRPRPVLTTEERKDALEAVDGKETCLFCGGLHHGASTPACPRLATFKLNGDGQVTEGSFWPEGITDAACELDGGGTVRAVTFHRNDQWDTSQIVRAADAAEEEDSTEAEQDTEAG